MSKHRLVDISHFGGIESLVIRSASKVTNKGDSEL